MNRTILAMVAAIVLSGCGNADSAKTTRTAAFGTDDEAAVRRLVDGFAKTWNQHDMNAMHELDPVLVVVLVASLAEDFLGIKPSRQGKVAGLLPHVKACVKKNPSRIAFAKVFFPIVSILVHTSHRF